MAETVALFGGTFDPVHLGHLITARAVAERCGFERITLVPAAAPPHKQGPRATGAERMDMLRLAIEGDPLLDICDLELGRTGLSYTYDTLKAVRAARGPGARLHWIIGADMLDGLHTWHRAGEVLNLARVVVAARPPWNERIDEILAGLRGRLGANHVESLRRGLVTTPLIDISSTDIRRRAAEGRPIRYLVPETVRAYIETKGIYRSE